MKGFGNARVVCDCREAGIRCWDAACSIRYGVRLRKNPWVSPGLHGSRRSCLLCCINIAALTGLPGRMLMLAREFNLAHRNLAAVDAVLMAVMINAGACMRGCS